MVDILDLVKEDDIENFILRFKDLQSLKNY